MKNNPIGIIDSGVGGLSVWKEIKTLLPDVSTLYVADQVNCPYGNKTSEEIYELSIQMVNWLIKQQVKTIVVACNTITVSALDKLRQNYPEVLFVGTVPAIKTAGEISVIKRIGVLSTSSTTNSEYQKNLIEKFGNGSVVVTVGTDDLVPFVEKGDLHSLVLKEIIKKELIPFQDAEIDTLVLGCTHFPFLKSQIHKVLGENVSIIDSGLAIAKQVQRILIEKNELSQGKTEHIFHTTGNKNLLSQTLSILLDEEDRSTIQGIEQLSI